MDAAVRRADPAWAAYLTSTVVDFVVWGSRPTGYVDPHAAQWLEPLLCSNPSKAARQILREVLREAKAVDPVLRDAMLQTHRRPIDCLKSRLPLPTRAAIWAATVCVPNVGEAAGRHSGTPARRNPSLMRSSLPECLNTARSGKVRKETSGRSVASR